MLVDNITLTIKAGNGGNGAATFLRNGQTAKGGPDGGNGGNGGNIYVEGSNNISDLRQFRFQKKIIAEDGVPGKNKKLYGKNAPHTTFSVPLGTKITDTNSGDVFEVADTTTPILLAQGGKGGRGNVEFKSATNQAPTTFERGTPGEIKKLLLELKLIAQVGLIGLPNAGKSSLLAAITHATPKIGDYPFTTLEPNIGMFERYAIADIPGLIEGASLGKGLGITFLKHIEKTKILIHCIAANDPDPIKSYKTVMQEFQQYDTSLLTKIEIILITKTDLVDKKVLQTIMTLFKKQKKEVQTCSIYEPETIDQLKKTLRDTLITLDEK